MKKTLLILLLLNIFFNNNAFADDKMKIGLDVFTNKAQCGACHALEDSGSEGQVGPSLDALKPKMSQIIYAVTNGIGVMPPWDGILTPEEIEAVAYYVFNSTNK
jgi:cytochrome c6